MAVDTSSIPLDITAPVDTFEGPLAASDRWRTFVAMHPFAAASIAGLIATQMATLVGYYFIGVGLPQTPWPLFNGFLVAPSDAYGTVASYFAGQSIHMVDAVVFTILYAVLVYGRMPGPNSVGGDIAKGIVYGLILGLISMGFLVPYVYAPKQGFGFFSFYTANTWKLPLSIALWHLTYGFLVGTLYSPIRARQSRMS
jgi:hypothetical protein